MFIYKCIYYYSIEYCIYEVQCTFHKQTNDNQCSANEKQSNKHYERRKNKINIEVYKTKNLKAKTNEMKTITNSNILCFNCVEKKT